MLQHLFLKWMLKKMIYIVFIFKHSKLPLRLKFKTLCKKQELRIQVQI